MATARRLPDDPPCIGTSRAGPSSVVEMVVHQLPEVLEPGPLVERDCSASGVNLDATAPGGPREVEQYPNDLGAHTAATVRLRDVHRLDVSVNAVKIAWLGNAVHQREEAHADGFATVHGNDRSEVTFLLGPPVGEPPFEGGSVEVIVTMPFGPPAENRERADIFCSGFPNLYRHSVRNAGPPALHRHIPMGCAPAMGLTGGVAVQPAASRWGAIPDRPSTRRWLWFLAWAAVGAMVPMVVLGAFTIGLFFIPVAGVLTLILLSRRASWVGLPGLITGAGLPLLVVAYLNRSGPGNICSTNPDGSGGCTQQWTPWPFLLVGLGLLIGGIIVFKQRPKPPAPAWYPDPWQPGGLRWWDGRSWTGYTSTQPEAQSPGQIPRT